MAARSRVHERRRPPEVRRVARKAALWLAFDSASPAEDEDFLLTGLTVLEGSLAAPDWLTGCLYRNSDSLVFSTAV